MNLNDMNIKGNRFHAPGGKISVALNHAQAAEAAPTDDYDGVEDQFDSWYVAKQAIADGGFYGRESQQYFKKNISVVIAQVEDAPVRSAREFDVAYGMKAEINPQVRVSQYGLGCLLKNAYLL
jgi:hypothetical protein